MTSNQDWWPNQLSLNALRQNSPQSDPMAEDFNYAEAVKNLDVDALKTDIEQVMTTSQKLGGEGARPDLCDVQDTDSFQRQVSHLLDHSRLLELT